MLVEAAAFVRKPNSVMNIRAGLNEKLHLNARTTLFLIKQ